MAICLLTCSFLFFLYFRKKKRKEIGNTYKFDDIIWPPVGYVCSHRARKMIHLRDCDKTLKFIYRICFFPFLIINLFLNILWGFFFQLNGKYLRCFFNFDEKFFEGENFVKFNEWKANFFIWKILWTLHGVSMRFKWKNMSFKW